MKRDEEWIENYDRLNRILVFLEGIEVVDGISTLSIREEVLAIKKYLQRVSQNG